jgi:probable HAF family extracellular repeat protein
VDDSHITATVPASAVSGSVTVTTAAGISNGVAFTVILSPTISSFAPTSGVAGTAVTITGANLAGASGVTFNGTASTNVTSVNATQVKATVPPGATTGKIAVTTIAGTGTSGTNFTIPLAITSFDPTYGPVGTHVAIHGSFASVSGAKIGDVVVDIASATPTQVEIVVPDGAQTGPITISNGVNSVTTTSNFTVTLPVIVDLGSFGNSSCFYSSYTAVDTVATAINDAGVVTGGSCKVIQNANGFYTNLHPFRWANGVMTDLDPTTTVETVGYGINSSSQIVGFFGDTMQIPGSAFLYSGGTFTDLASILGSVSPASDINDSGLIVGGRNTQGGETAYTYDPGAGIVSTLPGLGGAVGVAEAANNGGVLAGYATDASAQPHAVRWTGGTATDLGTLGGTYSYGFGINSAGDVVGQSTITGNTSSHAFLYHDGTMSDLGTLGGASSGAYGIDDSGDIVGWAWPASGGEHAFLYHDGVMADLNDRLPAGSGWVLLEARAINSLGQIVGIGRVNGGNIRGFLLNPSSLTQP